MSEPTTLRALTGMPATPASLADSTLIMIDLQNTYTRGVMELEGVQPALDQAAELLDRARTRRHPGDPHPARRRRGHASTTCAARSARSSTGWRRATARR